MVCGLGWGLIRTDRLARFPAIKDLCWPPLRSFHQLQRITSNLAPPVSTAEIATLSHETRQGKLKLQTHWRKKGSPCTTDLSSNIQQVALVYLFAYLVDAGSMHLLTCVLKLVCPRTSS